MKRTHDRWVASVALMLLAGPALAAGTAAPPAPRPKAPAPAAPVTPADAPLPAWVQNHLDRVMEHQIAPRFTVGDQLEGTALEAARDMAAEHLPRVRALMQSWAREALRRPEQAGMANVVAHARLANAMALWGVDSLGPAYDERLLQALQSRSACDRGERSNASELEARLLRLKTLPPDALADALRDERALLARWGQDAQRRATTAVVEPFVLDDAVRRWRAGVGEAIPALSPVLSHRFLHPDPAFRLEVNDPNPAFRCAWQQWGLWVALQGAPTSDQRRQALARWREGLKTDVVSLVWRSPEDAIKPRPGAGPYPEMAGVFQVTGTVELALTLDGAGKATQWAVKRRALNVVGLPADERPAAFEALMDAATIALARSEVHRLSDATSGGTEGLAVTKTYQWTAR